MADAKEKADEQNGKEENPDEVPVTEGEATVVDPGFDTTSGSVDDATRGGAIAAQGAKDTGELFKKSSIVAVINDPNDAIAILEKNAKIKKKIKNFVDLQKAPRGSLLVKPLDEKVEATFTVAFPFFQSHLLLPTNIGEAVWTISLGGRMYWFSRISGSGVSEDANFTHVDRDLSIPAENKDSAKEKEQKATGKAKNFIAKLFSGMGKDSGREGTKDESAKTENILKAPIYGSTNMESVPRFTPRQGDLVLQGSYNSLISLTTDRGWSKLDETFDNSNNIHEWEPGRGTIDLVVGRGMPDKDAEEIKPTTESTKGSDPERTMAPIIENDIGGVETNKQTKVNDQQGNNAEGDPDFHTDLSRIYLSMKSPIDERLTLKEQSPVLAGSSPLEDQEDACIALKTNQVRIIAREEGSIRIIKEGDPEAEPDDTTRASIIIQPNGSIHLVGQEIYLGKSKDEGGHPNEISGPIEPGEMQPYILFSVMKEYLESVHKSIDSFCQTLLTHTTPGYGSPSPQINDAAKKLKSDMKKHQDFIEKLASQRIFGE